jgi:hypothetical protein
MIAGGIHAEIGTKYFRVGHMHISSTNASLQHIDTVSPLALGRPLGNIPQQQGDDLLSNIEGDVRHSHILRTPHTPQVIAAAGAALEVSGFDLKAAAAARGSGATLAARLNVAAASHDEL